MPIGELCNRDVITIHQDATLSEAAALMRHHHVGALVVLETEGSTEPVGLVTDRDIVVGVLGMGIDPTTLDVGDIMYRELLTVREHDGIWETIQAMRDKGVRRAPVVDAAGNLFGIISIDDLFELIAGEASELVKLIRHEQQREMQLRP